MLCDEEDAGGETQHRDASPRRRFHIAVERVNAGEQAAGRSDIGGYQGTVIQGAINLDVK